MFGQRASFALTRSLLFGLQDYLLLTLLLGPSPPPPREYFGLFLYVSINWNFVPVNFVFILLHEQSKQIVIKVGILAYTTMSVTYIM